MIQDIAYPIIIFVVTIVVSFIEKLIENKNFVEVLKLIFKMCTVFTRLFIKYGFILTNVFGTNTIKMMFVLRNQLLSTIVFINNNKQLFFVVFDQLKKFLDQFKLTFSSLDPNFFFLFDKINKKFDKELAELYNEISNKNEIELNKILERKLFSLQTGNIENINLNDFSTEKTKVTKLIKHKKQH